MISDGIGRHWTSNGRGVRRVCGGYPGKGGGGLVHGLALRCGRVMDDLGFLGE